MDLRQPHLGTAVSANNNRLKAICCAIVVTNMVVAAAVGFLVYEKISEKFLENTEKDGASTRFTTVPSSKTKTVSTSHTSIAIPPIDVATTVAVVAPTKQYFITSSPRDISSITHLKTTSAPYISTSAPACTTNLIGLILESCEDVQAAGCHTSGVYTVRPEYYGQDLEVYCDLVTDGGGWVVFQRREDGSENFERTWNEYETRFGDVTGEHWLGLYPIDRITVNTQQLRIDMEDWEGNTPYAKYERINIGSAQFDYRIRLADNYTGNAGNALYPVYNMARFATKDSNTTFQPFTPEFEFGGFWWNNGLHLNELTVNLNGLYFERGITDQPRKGIFWGPWKGYNYSLKKTEMKLKKASPLKQA